MKALQIALFVLAVAAFLAALVAAGTDLGDIFWRAGMALLLSDLVVMKLWPAPSARSAT